MRIYLVRHTPVNLLDGICYGRSDVELSPDWALHFDSTRSKLPTEVVESGWVYSSPLRRCLDFANTLTDTVVTDERLREFDFGSWELRRWDEIPQPEMRSWTDDILRVAPPGGESLQTLSDRCDAFCDDLIARGHESAIVVTHGGVVRCVLAKMLGLPVTNAFRLRIDYGSVTQVRVGAEVIQVDYVNR